MLSTYLQNWMAFTTLKVGNFTLTKTVMLNNASSNSITVTMRTVRSVLKLVL